jgi:glycosyltransferase involved in cell wall biosynthesis
MLVSSTTVKPRVLIFIGSLSSGGKERRLIELLTYFKAKDIFEFLVVVTKDDIHYKDFLKLDIPYVVVKKLVKKNDPTVFYQLYKISKKFKPHLIHTWGRMQSFYALPAVIGQGVPLINCQITSAPPKRNRWSFGTLIDRINFRFSKVILANSMAGIESYRPPAAKAKVIYNGINMERFSCLPDRDAIRLKYSIFTPYSVLMAASFTNHKDYDLFYKIADRITKRRDDVSFVGVGGCGSDDTQYKKLVNLSKGNSRIIFPGRINDVEALINVCTIGVLFSNKSVHGEGISNAIMEYMSLAKPVVANDAGGTREIVHHNTNGYLIVDQTEDEIVDLVMELVDDEDKCKRFGNKSMSIIKESFSLDSMGKAFEQVYRESLVTTAGKQNEI